MKMKLKNKKSIILIILLIFLLVILSIVINRKNISSIYNAYIKKLNSQNEDDIISIDVSIKETQDNINKCLLIFTANDENEKIKSIQYPGEEQNKIVVNDEQGKKTIAIDYDIEEGKEDNTFIVTTVNGKVENERTAYTIEYKKDNGETLKTVTELRCIKHKIISTSLEKEGKHFVGWSTNKEAKVPDYFENGESNKDAVLYPIWIDEASGTTDDLGNESIIGKVSAINESGEKQIQVNGETYTANVIVVNKDIVLDGEKTIDGATLENNVYEFGNKETDVAKQGEYAKNMVILKVEGNLTITSNVTLTACKSDTGYGGPKGLLIYCTGTLTNNGTISMTARGAYAQGQNVYLWQNQDEHNYECVPATGAAGGAAFNLSTYLAERNGNNGSNGINRSTGGGGTGSGRTYGHNIYIGAGGTGTSYSGGSGSGASNSDGMAGGYAASQNASSEGGAGSNGVVASRNTSGYGQISMGGTGNPSGNYGNYKVEPARYIKREGTGGLLITYSKNVTNNGKIESNGVSPSTSSRSHNNSRVDTGGASRRRKHKYIL